MGVGLIRRSIAEGGTLYGSSITSIGYVQAWNTISGDIEAKNWNLGAVRVIADENVTANPGGITGDIKAEHGLIEAIYSTGPIGTPLRNSQIRAGNTIKEIRCGLSDGSTFTPATKNIYADIVSNTEYLNGNDSAFGAYIGLLQTRGSVYGSISTDKLLTIDFVGTGGIIVDGVVDAEINITGFLEKSSIIAASFTQPITIGLQSEGTIVATDEDYGEIVSVEIGYNIDPPADFLAYPRGMFALTCKPVSPALTGDPDVFEQESLTNRATAWRE